jgi:TPP-dependent pyruvate/acetoin dehydrogenase alpha subunit
MANPFSQGSPAGIRRTSHYSRLAEELAEPCAPPLLAEADLVRCYTQLLRIRRVEEEIVRLYPTDKIKSPVHLSIGQEAVSVAVCDHLNRGDAVFATYRGHAAYLAKGGGLKEMWAELYGKATGCGRGKAGSMHLVDTDVNMMGTSAIVATGIPDAVGYALAVKMKQEDRIVVCFFGEGATDEGVTHESINFAALHKLPILFVCENNEYAIYSHVSARMAGYGLCDRYRAYGIACERDDSGDFLAMHEMAGRAVADARDGFGPRFIEIKTARWRDHVGPGEDRQYDYRCLETLDATIKDDQVKKVGELLGEEARGKIAEEVEHEIASAIQFAEASPFPADQEVHDHVFASGK